MPDTHEDESKQAVSNELEQVAAVGMSSNQEPGPAQEAWTGAQHLDTTPKARDGQYGTVVGEKVAGTQAGQEGEEPSTKKGPRTRNIVIGFAVVVAAIVLVVCVGLFAGGKTQTVTSDWLSIEVPEDWAVEAFSVTEDGTFESFGEDAESDDFEFYMAIGGPYMINDDPQTLIEAFDLLEDTETLNEFTIDGAIVRRFEVDSADILWGVSEVAEGIDESAEWAGYDQFVYSGSEYCGIYVRCLADKYEEDVDKLEKILDSMVLEDASEPEIAMQMLSDGEISIEVPAVWTVEDSDSRVDFMAYPDDRSQMVLLYTGIDISDVENLDDVLLVLESDSGVDSSTLEQSEYGDGAIVCRYDYSDDDAGATGYAEFVISGDTLSEIYIYCLDDELSEHSEMLETILDSLTIENPSEPDFS